MLVRSFQEYLDSSYLQFLIEVIRDGNQYKLKLKKSQVKLNPIDYLPPEDFEEENLIDLKMIDPHFFTINGLISDMWQAYKWEPFKQKTDMLFKSVDFKPDINDLNEIKKHVILRNCIQHHEGIVDRDTMKQLGVDKVKMKKEHGIYEISAWEKINIDEHELFSLIDILMKLNNEFHQFVIANIPKNLIFSRHII